MVSAPTFPAPATALSLPDHLYPFTCRFLFLEPHGARLHYIDEGQGEPVVMVHGNPTWSFYFRSLVAGLRDRYRVVAPDHIGCGLSDKPPEDRYRYRLEQRADDLEALLDHLGQRERLTLVLHDWGGMIGMAYANRHPERIARLVILNTAAFLLPEGKKLPWQLWLVRNTPLGPLLVRGLNAFSRGAVRYCVTRPMPPDVRAAYLKPYGSWKDRLAVLRFVQDIPLAPGDPSYELVRSVQDGLGRFEKTPMLICWGAKDFVFDVHFLAEWQRRFPAALVHQFADAGHLVLEDAGDRILPLVRDFLARHPVSKP
jgi:pimeloyl-ACP methyl ester carboxylesterase